MNDEFDLGPTPCSKTMAEPLALGVFDDMPGARQLAEAARELLG